MKIANPLYDHAFRYLMSNDRLARKVLSVILEKEVLQLELAQQESIDHPGPAFSVFIYSHFLRIFA